MYQDTQCDLLLYVKNPYFSAYDLLKAQMKAQIWIFRTAGQLKEFYMTTVNQSNSNYKQKAEYVCSLSSVRNNAWEAKSITYETRKYQQLRIGGKRLHSTSHTTPQQQALGHKVRKFCILQRAHLIVELQLPAITKKEQCKIFYFLTILHAENLRGCYVFTSLHSWRLAYSLQQIYFRGWVAQNIRLKNSFRVW